MAVPISAYGAFGKPDTAMEVPMSDGAFAFWRRLDRPGHDAARLFRSATGWTIEGHAAFHEHGPTGLWYLVELAPDFTTIGATVEGHRSGEEFLHRFSREGGNWSLDGEKVAGLGDLVHLDFGFTPATNLQQVRHAGLGVGEEAEISAAWFDIGEASLVRLPQQYRRIAEDRYWYRSPMGGYEAVLEMARNGFVRLYPELWEMEPLRG
jgi:hypothetical protein